MDLAGPPDASGSVFASDLTPLRWRFAPEPRVLRSPTTAHHVLAQ